MINNNDFTLLTGACGGLGTAFVKELAKKGENLLLTATSQDKLSNLIENNRELFRDIKVKTFICDLALGEDRENLVKMILSERINIIRLINNAGVIIEGKLDNFSDSEIEKTIMVNCVGTLDLTKKILNIRDKDKLFEVLTVSSLAYNFPIPYMAVYSATKSFLVSVMTALSVEYKNENVTFSTVCPSGMPTTPAMKESIDSMGLGGRLTSHSPEVVAKKALKGLSKKKKIVVIGGFNKLLLLISKPFSKPFLSKITGRIWKKSQNKRNF